MLIYIRQSYSSNHLTLPFPLCVHKSILYVCLYSCPANRFISRFHIYVLIYLFFSFLLTLLCITGSRFFHISLLLFDNLEWWDVMKVGGMLKREGIYVYLWLILLVLWQKSIQHY